MARWKPALCRLFRINYRQQSGAIRGEIVAADGTRR